MSHAEIWFLLFTITMTLVLALYAHIRIDRMEDDEAVRRSVSEPTRDKESR